MNVCVLGRFIPIVISAIMLVSPLILPLPVNAGMGDGLKGMMGGKSDKKSDKNAVAQQREADDSYDLVKQRLEYIELTVEFAIDALQYSKLALMDVQILNEDTELLKELTLKGKASKEVTDAEEKRESLRKKLVKTEKAIAKFDSVSDIGAGDMQTKLKYVQSKEKTKFSLNDQDEQIALQKKKIKEMPKDEFQKLNARMDHIKDAQRYLGKSVLFQLIAAYQVKKLIPRAKGLAESAKTMGAMDKVKYSSTFLKAPKMLFDMTTSIPSTFGTTVRLMTINCGVTGEELPPETRINLSPAGLGIDMAKQSLTGGLAPRKE